MNNSWGDKFRIRLFGASHAEEVGVVVDGVPAGISLREALFADDLARRRPQLRGETTRVEADRPTIEGVDSEGVTTGGSITIRFANSNTRSADYGRLKYQPRPSHADLVQRRKYGEDYSLAGGGIASGRMTVALVAAGVVAKELLDGVVFDTRLVEVGGVCDEARFEDVVASAARDGDSVGGVVECRISGDMALLGEPFFDSVESVMAHLLFSIPGVKGVEFGDGFEGARKRGSERNDVIISVDGATATNNEGGINGGIANGNDIVFRVAIKPTPSIAREQRSFDFRSLQIEPLTIGGRHDSCIARRALVVVEAVAAIALVELKMRG